MTTTARQTARKRRAVSYPETDGKPLAESELHLDVIIRGLDIMRGLFADNSMVYVGGDLLIYYEEGNPRRSVAPALFVVRGVPKLPKRDIFKLWEEGAAPCFVIEFTSKTTRREDMTLKRAIYERLGVREYFLYDPRSEYLAPPLQGYRLDEGRYRPIDSDADGGLISEETGLRLVIANGDLQYEDLATGQRLLSAAEQLQRESDMRAALEREVAELRARLEAANPGPS